MTASGRIWYNEIGREIVGAAIEVHRELGPGLLEAVYETCMMKELADRRLSVTNQVNLPIEYKGESLDKYFTIDILVEDAVIIELKSVAEMQGIYTAQILTYLRLSGKKLGYLINFNVPLLKSGIRRFINGEI
ncbi:MAG: GxxExxY protein [Tannerella sp.]|jgi:GxxExxY protein|nr:GxxExxY protein [Tannerella sp.]